MSTSATVLDHSDLWRIIRSHRHARLSYPGGPGYHGLIVDYRVVDEALAVDLPSSEACSDDLSQRLITLEILDDYLASTPEHVQIVGRALGLVRSPRRSAPGGLPWATAASAAASLMVTPVCIECDEA